MEWGFDSPFSHQERISVDTKELEDIALTIEGIHNKAKMLSFIAKNKNSEAEVGTICDWIESTWTNDTVRAKMARKISKMIRNGEHRTIC